jgi:Spy/CpxP family protein refolding chaperone
MNPCILTALNLTGPQLEQMRALKEKYQREVIPLHTQRFEREAELNLLWMQTKPESDKILAKQKEIHQIVWQIEEKATTYRLAFRSILTPEQLVKFLAMGGDMAADRRPDELSRRERHMPPDLDDDNPPPPSGPDENSNPRQ